MSETAGEEPTVPATSPGTRWGQINEELRRLEGRDDPESRARFAELLDELMGVDMSLQPFRQAMGRKRDRGPAEAPPSR